MKRRRTIWTMGAAAAILSPAIPGTAQSYGQVPDPYRYSNAERGLELELFPTSFQRFGEDIRQGDFRLDIGEQESGLGTAIRMDGTVQLNCRTREARMVAIRVVDAQGKPADALVGDARAPTPWRALADTRDDAYLFMVLCGAAAGPQMYEPSAPPPGAFVTFDDYPARALREGREGIVGFRAAFDASGAVVGCEIIASSGHADLDEETCRLVRRRGRFTPAPAGTGLRYYESRVRWQIP